MYQIKRISKVPATPFRVAVDNVDLGDGDGGFLAGGLFYFAPAGEDGDTHQVSEHAAKVIMGDHGLAPHFECTPALKATKHGKSAATAHEAAGDAKPAVGHKTVEDKAHKT